MKTFTLQSKYEALIDGRTRLLVLDPTSIKLMESSTECMGTPVYEIYGESWTMKNGKKVDVCPTWDGSQNVWGMGANNTGHVLKALIAQRDAAIDLIHDIYNEVMIDGGLGEEMGKRIKAAIGAEL